MAYTLTPADIMELRASVRWRLSDQGAGGPTRAGDLISSIPFICYAREDRMAQNAPGYDPEAFVLHTQGHMRAISKRIEMLGECLRQEFAQPGFMVRVMDERENCEVALLDPASAAVLASRRRFEEAATRAYAEEEKRRLSTQARKTTPKPDPLATDIFDD
jgi:hypothetical protein